MTQTLPPDEIIVCTNNNNGDLEKEISIAHKHSFIPISFIKNDRNKQSVHCINKAIESTNKEFIIVSYGNSVLFTQKFISHNLNKTRPGSYSISRSLGLNSKLHRRFANKKIIRTLPCIISLGKQLLLKLKNSNKLNISNNEPCSISFFKQDYKAQLTQNNSNKLLKNIIINSLNDNARKQTFRYPQLQYHKIEIRKKVLVCLDRLKFLNCGLGQVALNFGREILNKKPDNYDIVLMLPKKGFKEFEEKSNYIKLNIFKSIFSRYMKNYDLCHIPHQLPSYSFGHSNKNILTIHDLNFIFTKSLFKSNRYLHRVQNNIKKADAIVFISDFTRQMTHKYLNIPKNKITEVIYNGVIMPENCKIRPKWLPNKHFLFSIGQFLEKKNFHVLLPFIQKFPDDLILIIAGENQTSYGERLIQEVEKLGIEDKVIFPGGISDEDKGYLYHNCTAFLFPSIAEGFGLPVIEAMLCSKPVFCSDKTSLREIGREFAFFWTDFEVNNMLQVYKKGMETIITTQHIKRQKEYAQTYTYKKNVEEYLKVYDALL